MNHIYLNYIYIYIVALTAADTWSEFYGQYKDDKEPTDEFIKSRIYKFFSTVGRQIEQNTLDSCCFTSHFQLTSRKVKTLNIITAIIS